MSRTFPKECDRLRPTFWRICWYWEDARSDAHKLMICLKLYWHGNVQTSAGIGDFIKYMKYIDSIYLTYATVILKFFVSPTITVRSFEEIDNVVAFWVLCELAKSKNIWGMSQELLWDACKCRNLLILDEFKSSSKANYLSTYLTLLSLKRFAG